MPSHEVDTFTHIKRSHLQACDGFKPKILALVIPKSWHFAILIDTHDKLGHQTVNRTYHIIKHQYYWKGMNKDICKYINNCALCTMEKARTHVCPLQMNDIPDRPFTIIARRPGLRSQCLCLRKSTYTDYHWSLNRMARSFPHPWQESRHQCLGLCQ